MTPKSTKTNGGDPTQNVKELTEAAQKRQDDLASAQAKLVEVQIKHTSEMAALRAEYTKEIRALDVLAGDTAARRADLAIGTLASTTATNAETLRAVVASTAANLATQLDQKLASVADTIRSIEKSLSERIAALEKSSYTGAGKEGVTDPMMGKVVERIESLINTREKTTGKSEGGQLVWGLVAAGFGFVLTLLTIAGLIISFIK